MEVQQILYVDLLNMDSGGPVHDQETAADESCFVESGRFRACPRVEQYGVQIPKDAWHMIEVKEENTLFEAKDGTYWK